MPEIGAKRFFEAIVQKEMERRLFQNLVVQSYISSLLYNFLTIENGLSVFHVRRDPALATLLPGLERAKLKDIGDRLLFGIGFFPEHFVARGKRRVSIKYYHDLLKHAVARRLSLRSNSWQEIYWNFSPTVSVMNGVRSQLAYRMPDIATLAEIISATGLSDIFPDRYKL